jgi:phage terminase small subunit
VALSLKQRRFVEFYLGRANGNATEAAKLAGYSERSAASVGSENLRKPDISAEISRRLDEAAMPAAEVLARLAAQARGSLADFIDLDVEEPDPETGEPVRRAWRLNLAKAEEAGLMPLVKTLAWTEHGPKLELHDAQAALGLLAKRHGLLTDRTEVSGPGGGPVQVEAAPDLSRLSGEELESLERLLTKAAADPG